MTSTLQIVTNFGSEGYTRNFEHIKIKYLHVMTSLKNIALSNLDKNNLLFVVWINNTTLLWPIKVQVLKQGQWWRNRS